jgi:hypothetical protein
MAVGLWLALIVLRSRIPFALHYEISTIWFSSVFLAGVLVAIATRIISIEILGLKGVAFLIFWVAFATVPLFWLAIRALFVALCELYSITNED